jgi:acyl-CoA thioesterase-2
MADFPRNPVIEGSEITLPFDVREVDVRSLTVDARGRPRDTSRMLWARVTEEIDDDPLTRSCIVAYISDFGATIGARTLVGATTKTPGRFASLNHTLWWHRPFELSDWLLIDFRPLTAASSRGLVSATVHTADGRHVATLNQEAMMRLS